MVGLINKGFISALKNVLEELIRNKLRLTLLYIFVYLFLRLHGNKSVNVSQYILRTKRTLWSKDVTSCYDSFCSASYLRYNFQTIRMAVKFLNLKLCNVL